MLTGQEQLDAWARERTLGLIDRFPIQVTSDLMLVLASAVATKVRWWQPFDVVPATELSVRRRRGGFADAVTRALRSVPGHDVRLVHTQAAGLVGAHVAASRDGLAVVSVLGPVDVDRAGVLAAAYEVALGLDGGSGSGSGSPVRRARRPIRSRGDRRGDRDGDPRLYRSGVRGPADLARVDASSTS